MAYILIKTNISFFFFFCHKVNRTLCCLQFLPDNDAHLTVRSSRSIPVHDGLPSISISQATPTSTLRKPSSSPSLSPNPLKPHQDSGPRIFKKKAPSTPLMQLTARDLLAKQIDNEVQESNLGPPMYEEAENRNNDALPSSSSQDYLLRGEECHLRPINKIEDVKTIKRQSRDGWM